MIWIVYALPCLVVVYLAARFSRFRRFAEPLLSVAAAIGLISAFVIWMTDDNTAQPPESTQSLPAVTASDIVLGNLTYTPSRPETSYRVTGTIENRSSVVLDYFRLTVTLENCPANACTLVGSDEALILARLPAGKSMDFDTFFTITNPAQIDTTDPKWSYSIGEIRARALP